MEIKEIGPMSLTGKVVKIAEGSKSESWGIEIMFEDQPKQIGLKAYIEMKEDLEALEGQEIIACVDKLCKSFQDDCCPSAFDQCALLVVACEQVEAQLVGRGSYSRIIRVIAGRKVYKTSDSTAIIDVMNDSQNVYRLGIKLNLFSYYPVTKNGYVRVVQGSVRIG